MRSLTKSPLAFARAAVAAGKHRLPEYSHPFSPRKFTQPQLFAVLALKDFLHTDFRGVVQILSEWSDLREVLGLTQVPHYSTLCYAHRRLLKKTPSKPCLRGPLHSPAQKASSRSTLARRQ
jgi:hypothetical protein